MMVSVSRGGRFIRTTGCKQRVTHCLGLGASQHQTGELLHSSTQHWHSHMSSCSGPFVHAYGHSDALANLLEPADTYSELRPEELRTHRVIHHLCQGDPGIQSNTGLRTSVAEGTATESTQSVVIQQVYVVPARPCHALLCASRTPQFSKGDSLVCIIRVLSLHRQ